VNKFINKRASLFFKNNNIKFEYSYKNFGFFDIDNLNLRIRLEYINNRFYCTFIYFRLGKCNILGKSRNLNNLLEAVVEEIKNDEIYKRLENLKKL
jgi:hypothetical protein